MEDATDATDFQNALGTPEARAEWMARPENSQQAATPEQINAWVKAGGRFPLSVVQAFCW